MSATSWLLTTQATSHLPFINKAASSSGSFSMTFNCLYANLRKASSYWCPLLQKLVDQDCPDECMNTSWSFRFAHSPRSLAAVACHIHISAPCITSRNHFSRSIIHVTAIRKCCISLLYLGATWLMKWDKTIICWFDLQNTTIVILLQEFWVNSPFSVSFYWVFSLTSSDKLGLNFSQ